MQTLLDKLRKDFEKSILNMEAALKGTVMSKVAALDNQDCYELFGIGNSTLENLENLNSIIVNGLYDDADIVLRNGLIVYDYEAPDALSESDVLELMVAKRKASDYYKLHKHVVEGGTSVFNNPTSIESRVYRKLNAEFKKFKLKQ